MAIGRSEIDLLRRAGVLPATGYARAMALVRDGGSWARWARHALLALGVGHLLSGIVFFFAYNWAALPAIAKFALLEAGILAAAGVALWRGADRPEGASALIAATLLVGVLLAVIGQVYPSGAEPWQLFGLWAALALPWTIASRNAAHWLVWLVVLHIAAGLYADQVLVARGRLTVLGAVTCVSLLSLAALVARELLVHRGQMWAAARWTRLVPAIVGLGGLALGAGLFLLDGSGGTDLAAPVAFGAAAAALGTFYREKRPDLAVLAAVTGFAVLLLIAAAARVVADRIGFEETETALLSLAVLVFWSVAIVAGAARLLERLRRTMPADSDG